MRGATLISAAIAALIAHAAPAFADCLEEVEGYELAALQNDLKVSDDPGLTPTARGRTAFSKHVQDYLLEAETAARAGNEPQCLAIFATALEIARNE